MSWRACCYGFGVFCLAGLAGAHPMGNFSVNHYTLLEVGASRVEITYILDLGEVPAYPVLKDAKSPEDQAREWMRGLEFRGRTRRLEPRLVSAEVRTADGSGGLRTARYTMRMTVDGAGGWLQFEDRNFAERAGWKEIVIRAGAGATVVRASQAGTDRSKALTNYAGDAPQDLRASVEWRVGGGNRAPSIVPIEQPEAVVADKRDTAPAEPVRNDYLASLLGRKQIGLGLILAGMAVAFGLGAIHALSPGHGKTIVAAYLVGSRGTARHAAILGATVTFTHTISVFALGLATLFLSDYVAPQKIAPVLGVISGISIVAVGVWLLVKRWGYVRHEHEHGHHHHQHDHGHGHSHQHPHADISVLKKGTDRSVHGGGLSEGEGIAGGDRVVSPLFQHEHSAHGGGLSEGEGSATGDRVVSPLFQHGHSHVPEGEITMGSLLALGASGGLVPCPSALVLLLSSIALGRVGLGMVLLVAFSLGLAGVLMGIGMMVLYGKRWLPDPARASRHPVLRWTPVASAAVIAGVGVVMTAVALGVGRG